MQAYQQAKIGGFCHIYSGQEACAVGTIGRSSTPTRSSPPTATTATPSPAACTPTPAWPRCTASSAGCAKGKGGSHAHVRPPEQPLRRPRHRRRPNPPRRRARVRRALQVGSHRHRLQEAREPLLPGRRRGRPGRVPRGPQPRQPLLLPVIYIIENNGYSMGTAIDRHTANHDNLISRARPTASRRSRSTASTCSTSTTTSSRFVDECRDLQRPGFVDFKTYRYQGHSMSDPQKYRTKDEVDEFKEKDSIAKLASPPHEGRRRARLPDRGRLEGHAERDQGARSRTRRLRREPRGPRDRRRTLHRRLHQPRGPMPNESILSPTATYTHGARRTRCSRAWFLATTTCATTCGPRLGGSPATCSNRSTSRPRRSSWTSSPGP
jgi:hypothetical protein